MEYTKYEKYRPWILKILQAEVNFRSILGRWCFPHRGHIYAIVLFPKVMLKLMVRSAEDRGKIYR